jgi:hypothetical protein
MADYAPNRARHSHRYRIWPFEGRFLVPVAVSAPALRSKARWSWRRLRATARYADAQNTA